MPRKTNPKIAPLVRKYMRMLGVKVQPKIRIVDNLGSKWLGQTSWTSRTPETSTISLQKRIVSDDLTLEKIIAHEMVHHAEFMTLTPGDIASISAGIRPPEHGKRFSELAAKVNAVMGSKFVTVTSDKSYVEKKNTREFFLLVASVMGGKRFGWAWGVRITPKAQRRIDRAIASDGAILVKTTDAKWLNGAKLSQGGYALTKPGSPQEEELQAMLGVPSQKTSSQVPRRASVSRVLRRYLRASTSKQKLDSLGPNDVLVVYHGTGLQQAYSLVNGFDANTEYSRLYGGPRHKGVFITPKVSVADRFSNRGQIILEIMVRAKNLHGVDYSGNIGRAQEMDPETRKWIRESHPNSFRPYLSMTMLQSVEPQGLLRGLVKPSQILRVRYKEYGEEPVWYTRKEFLALDLETVPGGGYGPKKKVEDVGVDLSYPGYSVEETITNLTKLSRRPRDRVVKMLGIYAKKGVDLMTEFIMRFGFGVTASKAMAERIVDHFTLQSPQTSGGRSAHMSEKSLRNAIIRLAHKRPEFRGDLLPLVAETRKRAALRPEQAFEKLKRTRELSTDLLKPLGISMDSFLRYAQLPDRQAKRMMDQAIEALSKRFRRASSKQARMSEANFSDAFGREKPVELVFSSKEKAREFAKRAKASEARGKFSVRKTKGWSTYSVHFTPVAYSDVVALHKLYKPEKPFYKDIMRDLKLASAPKQARMSTDARELELFIENDGNLYRQQYQPIITNLMRKWKKGQYDFVKSIKLFMYLVDEGAKRYHKEHGTPGLPWHKAFPKQVRLEVAKSLAEGFKSEAEIGGYD